LAFVYVVYMCDLIDEICSAKLSPIKNQEHPEDFILSTFISITHTFILGLIATWLMKKPQIKKKEASSLSILMVMQTIHPPTQLL